MVREPDATMQSPPQDHQLMSKHRVLSFKPQLRLEWRGQDGQNETEQPDHSASLSDSITSSTHVFGTHSHSRRNSTNARTNAVVPLSECDNVFKDIPAGLVAFCLGHFLGDFII